MSKKANILYRLKHNCQLFILLLVPLVSSCATSVYVQPQVNSLVVAQKFDYALKVLEEDKQGYGKKNRLLFLMDYGLVLQLAGKYRESIKTFEEAKQIYDQLYTKSVSRYVSTWLINDNTSYYRGEDFERIMINILQAVNFAMLGDFNEALVEARDVDNKLALINNQYDSAKKNIYREDAFARFFMGLIYEASPNPQDLNDAYISYKKAAETYADDFQPNYGLGAPQILKENLLRLADLFEPNESKEFAREFAGTTALPFAEIGKKGEVYLINYYGLSPVKYERAIVVPTFEGHILKFAFPEYIKRDYDSAQRIFKADSLSGQEFSAQTESAEDIAAIAIKNLADRRVRFIAKTGFRSLGKLFVERAAETNIRKRYGDEAASWLNFLDNLYNLCSEQADLRSWQTLPAQIRIARLILEPGEYKFYFNGELLGEFKIAAGQKKFLVKRTSGY